MSAEDKILCSRAKKVLYVIQERETYGRAGGLTIPVPSCQRPLPCTSAREHILRDILGVIPRARALAPWHDRWNGRLCERCEMFAQKQHRLGRIVV